MVNDYAIQNVIIMLFSTQIIRTYLDTFPDRKKVSYKYSVLLWSIYILFQLWVIFTSASSPLLVLAVTIVLFFSFCMIFCRTNILSALFRACFLYAVWMMMEIGTNFILSKTGITVLPYGFIAGNTISKIFMYVTVHALKHYRKKEPFSNISFPYWLRLFVVPIITVYIIHNVYTLTYQNERNIFFLITTVLMVIINYITFNVYDQLGRKMEIEQKNLIYEQQLSLCNKQSAEREAAYQESRFVRHDLNQYLLDLKVDIEAKKNEEAIKKIDVILEKNRIYRSEISRSGNLVIDSLLNYKYSLALAEGILMECKVEIPEELPFEGVDLSIILGNLIDNALEAVEKLSK